MCQVHRTSSHLNNASLRERPFYAHFTDVATEAQKKGLGQGHQHSDGTTVTGPCCLDFQPSTGSGGSEHSESEYAWVWPLSPLPTV